MIHKAAAHNFSISKYKALRRMKLCSGFASSNSSRAALSVYTCVVYVWAASGGPTAVISEREIQRFFSPHGVRHRFVFYAADRELSEELPRELPRELPKELPEMRQVGLKLTKLAASLANASLANEENPSNFRVSTRTLSENSWWKPQAWFCHSQIKARASKGRSTSAPSSVTVSG